jgi:hypothetical protein
VSLASTHPADSCTSSTFAFEHVPQSLHFLFELLILLFQSGHVNIGGRSQVAFDVINGILWSFRFFVQSHQNFGERFQDSRFFKVLAKFFLFVRGRIVMGLDVVGIVVVVMMVVMMMIMMAVVVMVMIASRGIPRMILAGACLLKG